MCERLAPFLIHQIYCVGSTTLLRDVTVALDGGALQDLQFDDSEITLQVIANAHPQE